MDSINKKIVLATGTFDIFHPGHLEYLNYAKNLGDYLIVHIESDEAVKRHKGEDRPINNQFDRQAIINALKVVDETFIADGEREATEILRKYKPAIFVIALKEHYNTKKLENNYHRILPDLEVVWTRKYSDKSTSKIISHIKST